MKKIFALLLVFPFILNAQQDSENKGINWITGLSWEQIKTKAKTENKYIFVDAYATWCIPCKKMDKEVFSYWRVADVMKNDFIAVKVQMDRTSTDNAEVKSWYSDAMKIKNEYRVGGFPTYLFFTPDAKLIHTESGAMSVAAFIRVTQLARNPDKPKYYTLYEQYKQGYKDYNELRDLAIFTKKLIGDVEMANKMAKDYKDNHLKKLSDEKFYTRENFKFINEFNSLINTDDRFFYLFYNNEARADSLSELKGMSKRRIQSTIIREEIDSKLLKDGKGIVKFPKWEKIQKAIAMKYKAVPDSLIELWVHNYRINYYKGPLKDLKLWADAKDEKIKRYPPSIYFSTMSSNPLEFGYPVLELNDGGAWYAFLTCSDTAILKRALGWTDALLQLDSNWVAHIDTKANLLYKLGRVEEAIKWEQKAIEVDRKKRVEMRLEKLEDENLVETLSKMRKGIPTWPDSNK